MTNGLRDIRHGTVDKVNLFFTTQQKRNIFCERQKVYFLILKYARMEECQMKRGMWEFYVLFQECTLMYMYENT